MMLVVLLLIVVFFIPIICASINRYQVSKLQRGPRRKKPVTMTESVLVRTLEGAHKTLHSVGGASVVQTVWVWADLPKQDSNAEDQKEEQQGAEEDSEGAEEDVLFTIDILRSNVHGTPYQSILDGPIAISKNMETREMLDVSDYLQPHHIDPTDVLVVHRQAINGAVSAPSVVRLLLKPA